MQTNNHRRHTRRPCEVPVHIVAEGVSFDARLIDASRSGARLRVAGAPLGVYRLAPLTYVSRQVARLLGVEFEVRFDPNRLGSLLSKRLRPVRIGQRDVNSADVELGCVFSEAFKDEEAIVLGLSLPAVMADGSEPGAPKQEAAGSGAVPANARKPAAPASPPAGRLSVPPPPPSPSARPIPAPTHVVPAHPAPAKAHHPTGAPAAAPPVGSRPAASGQAGGPPPTPPRTARSRPGWRAFVHPVGAHEAPPFVAEAHNVSSAGVQLRVPERAMLQLSGPMDVASTMSALGATYGSDVALRLVDGSTPLWTGPARIEMIEVGAATPHPVTLWLAYSRALRPAEMRALELV